MAWIMAFKKQTFWPGLQSPGGVRSSYRRTDCPNADEIATWARFVICFNQCASHGLSPAEMLVFVWTGDAATDEVDFVPSTGRLSCTRAGLRPNADSGVGGLSWWVDNGGLGFTTLLTSFSENCCGCCFCCCSWPMLSSCCSNSSHLASTSNHHRLSHTDHSSVTVN